MMDLGGGSCELTISRAGHIAESVSLPLGAVRLTNEFLNHDPPRKGEMERLQSFVTRYTGKVAERIAAARVQMAVATSGTAAALADLSEHLFDGPRAVVTAAAGRKIAKLLAKLKVEERRRMPGIGPRRAEIVIAGAVVYAELLERCHLRSFRYSPLGLRDGLLAQMAAEYDRETRSGRQLESERWDALVTTVKRYRVDEKHAFRVREFALKLFDATRSVHRLPPEYREWLGAAALLYEVGDYINRDGRHRHTQYIIAHSEMLGFTVEQRRIVAAIARYMGKSRPSEDEPPMKMISPQNQAQIPKAISLLRLSRAINLGRSGAVADVKVTVQNAKVYLKVVPKRGHSAELELWALEKEQDYFREAFGRTLSAALA
jgi:exopolyphosphatase/guanosine-5'-triphosphate,3'-diphosphate pyrophosphatase